MQAEAVAGRAVGDLAVSLGVDPEDVHVIEASAVTWRDSSLGCPRPGMAYTQAVVDGFRVVLEAGGRTFRYHAGRDGKPFLCATPQPPLPEH